MNKFLLILVTFLTFNLFAQPPGGGGGGRSQGQRPQSNEVKEVKKFSANDVAGLFYYDIDEVIKKIKVKDEEKQYSVKKALKNYNFRIKEIKFLNSAKFSDLDIFMNSMTKEKDNDASQEMRKKVEEIIRPVRDSVHEYEKELNEILVGILSEKQQKKWLKYQKKKVESLQPKKPQNTNESSRPSRGGGMSRQ
ncbi:hypothetical protein [Polaribacter sp. AHE13PA]|jgi:hypothetical protein|uniref:hypothetical protein n=1 Tax=Polaribacter sp. AHE13PA TaxID=2745562 RepID=UPI001C4ECB2D|nr:hypothetical protein [Polaribacter sp. AHE13PA]QXP68395.1 hypothetical protein H0I28_07830 [Polaribacter sp. AHE13PA]